ncbi:LysR family transcriptional regulator [Enterococcus faecium]|nr:LysR family transcriptional regulator [Enterococcus faecium]MBK4846006.1 LysR family transcriptional regulator [Enterococcus faecium]
MIKAHPDIQFHLYSGNADDIIDKLDSGLLDFGLVIEPTNKNTSHFDCQPKIVGDF